MLDILFIMFCLIISPIVLYATLVSLAMIAIIVAGIYGAVRE